MTHYKTNSVYKNIHTITYPQFRFSGSRHQDHAYTDRLMKIINTKNVSLYDIELISSDLIIVYFTPDHEFQIKGFQGEEIKKVASFIIEELETLVLLGVIEHLKYFQIPDLKSGIMKK